MAVVAPLRPVLTTAEAVVELAAVSLPAFLLQLDCHRREAAAVGMAMLVVVC